MELLISSLLGFTLVLTRLSAFFICLPIFNWRSIPGIVKMSLGLWMAIFFACELTMPFDASRVTPLQAGVMIGSEIIYGGAMGLAAALVFLAIRVGGSIADQQMGYAMAEVLDPLSGEQVELIAMVVEMLFILLFLVTEGHHLFLMMLQKSYQVFPIGSVPDISMLTNMVVQSGAVMMTTALKITAPILAIFLVMMVVLGVLARVLPDMNLLFESMPMRVGTGLIAMTLLLPLMIDFVKEFSMWMNKLMPF